MHSTQWEHCICFGAISLALHANAASSMPITVETSHLCASGLRRAVRWRWRCPDAAAICSRTGTHDTTARSAMLSCTVMVSCIAAETLGKARSHALVQTCRPDCSEVMSVATTPSWATSCSQSMVCEAKSDTIVRACMRTYRISVTLVFGEAAPLTSGDWPCVNNSSSPTPTQAAIRRARMHMAAPCICEGKRSVSASAC